MKPSHRYRTSQAPAPDRALAAFIVLITAFAVGCGSGDVGRDRLKPLKSGATRSSVVELVGTGPVASAMPADSIMLLAGYRVQKFLADGVLHEVVWYREVPGTTNDPPRRETDTPIVIVNDTVAGWGWRFYNEYAARYNLPNPSRDRERLDSIANAQAPKP